MPLGPEQKGDLIRFYVSFTLHAENDETHQLPVSIHTEGFDTLDDSERTQVIQDFIDYLAAYPHLTGLYCSTNWIVEQRITLTGEE
jgi:hypothetical protein